MPIPLASGGYRPGSLSGIPDILGVYGGKGFNYLKAKETNKPGKGIMIGIEVKKGRDKIRPLQESFHIQARLVGAIILVVVGNTAEEIFNSFLDQWTRITSKI